MVTPFRKKVRVNIPRPRTGMAGWWRTTSFVELEVMECLPSGWVGQRGSSR
jgi:hypothetical protein